MNRSFTRRVERYRDVESNRHPIALSKDSQWGLQELSDRRYQLVRFVGPQTVQRYHTYYEHTELYTRALAHLSELE